MIKFNKRFFSSTIDKAKHLQKLRSISKPKRDVLIENHGHVRRDLYNSIRHDKQWQKRIIEREEGIFKNWEELTKREFAQWKEHVFRRTDPGMVDQIPEKFGDYIYFVKEKELPNNWGPYTVYCRHPASIMESSNSR